MVERFTPKSSARSELRNPSVPVGGKKKPSRAKRRMLERQRKPPNYSSESLRHAYEQKTRWVSKVQKRKE